MSRDEFNELIEELFENLDEEKYEDRYEDMNLARFTGEPNEFIKITKEEQIENLHEQIMDYVDCLELEIIKWRNKCI